MSGLKYIDEQTPTFFISSSSLEGRFDPYYYNSALKDFTENQNFPVKKIYEVVKSFTSGFGVGRQDQADADTGLIQIRPTNLDQYGLLKFDRNVYIPKDLIKHEGQLLEKGDVIFNNTNSQEWVGKAAYYDLEERLAFSNHITVLKVDDEQIDPRYLWLILNLYQQKKIFFSICTNWNNQSGVGLDLLRSLKIPVPDIDIQNQIVSTLENGYAKRKAQLIESTNLLLGIEDFILKTIGIELPERNTDFNSRIFKTALSQVAGRRLDSAFYLPFYIELTKRIESVNSAKLKEIIKFSTETWNQKDYFENTFPYIEISEIDLNTGKIMYVDQVPIQEAPSRAKKIVRTNDIIVSTTRPSRGAISLISENENSNICSTGFAVLREITHSEISREYLFWILRSKLSLLQMEQRSSGGNYPAITEDQLKEILIPVPNMELQLKIVDEANRRRFEAQRLTIEADKVLEDARAEIEQMILE
jgi:type I restriction enzyme S subunit